MRIASHLPFDPARWPFFYGWVIMICGPLGMLMSIPGQTMGVSVFTDPLIEVLQLTRDQLSLAYMIGTIGSSFLLPWSGKKYDELGARVLAILSSFGLGVVLLYLSTLPAILRYFGLGSNALIVMLFITFGFLFLRFFGQGVLTMTSRNMMMEWFERRRGMATGFSNSFVSLGFSAAPVVLYFLIERGTWSGAWQVLAVLAGIVFPIFAFFFFRDKPEDSGLVPDGGVHAGTAKPKKALFPVVKQYTRSEALRSYPFWVFSLMVAMHGLFITGFTFHVISIFAEVGMDESAAIKIFPQSAVIAVSVTLIASITSDHIQLKLLLYAMGVSACLGIAGMIFLGKLEVAYYGIAIGTGLASGLFSVILSVTWPRYFGRQHLGAISGQVTSLMVFFSALGPILFSLSLSAFGSYQVGGIICFTIFALLTLAAIKADNPQIRHGRENHPN
ncbi:MAG: MFS transporter [Bacteroidota bacterium]